MSIEMVDPSTLSQSLIQPTAEDAHEYAWIKALLEEVASSVRTACHRQGMETHWCLFWEYVMQPALGGSPATLTHLSEKYGIQPRKKVSNMIETVKRRFRAMLLQRVRNNVSSKERATEELNDLSCFEKTYLKCRQDHI
jgi:hypothetical protein